MKFKIIRNIYINNGRFDSEDDMDQPDQLIMLKNLIYML